jgi:hypothetical protein
MEVVITNENIRQVAQAMYENVKSNQHRLDEIEPVIHKMAKQIDRLDQMIVGNGFGKAVKDNARELKAFRSEFQDFKFNREDTCPVARRTRNQHTKEIQTRDWRATVIKLVFGSIGTVSTMIIIVEKVFV